jgi:hypothetical protein
VKKAALEFFEVIAGLVGFIAKERDAGTGRPATLLRIASRGEVNRLSSPAFGNATTRGQYQRQIDSRIR